MVGYIAALSKAPALLLDALLTVIPVVVEARQIFVVLEPAGFLDHVPAVLLRRIDVRDKSELIQFLRQPPHLAGAVRLGKAYHRLEHISPPGFQLPYGMAHGVQIVQPLPFQTQAGGDFRRQFVRLHAQTDVVQIAGAYPEQCPPNLPGRCRKIQVPHFALLFWHCLQYQRVVSVEIRGERTAAIDLLQFHAVVVGHPVGRDCALFAVDQLQRFRPPIQGVVLLHRHHAAADVQAVIPANLFQIGEVRDHRGLLAAEGQVDKILNIRQIPLCRHTLELRSLLLVEAVQPLGKVVQFVHSRISLFQLPENRKAAVHLDNTAVLPQRVPDFQALQQFHRMVILAARNGERYGDLPIFRVGAGSEYSFHNHVSVLPIRITSGPYRTVTTAQRISSRVSSSTSSGSASSSDVAPSVPEQIPFAAR